MNGEFPVDVWTPEFFFGPHGHETRRIELVDAPSSFASLDASRAARRIGPFPANVSDLVLNCGSSHSCLRPIHRGTVLSDRGTAGRSGSMARLHRANSRRADRADAVLRPDTGGGGETSERLAHARARTAHEERICIKPFVPTMRS